MQEEPRNFQAELKEVADKFELSKDYRDLRGFYEEMVGLGLVVKHPYGFNQSDTSTLQLTPSPNVNEGKSWFGTYLEQSVR